MMCASAFIKCFMLNLGAYTELQTKPFIYLWESIVQILSIVTYCIVAELYGCTTWTLTKHLEKKLDGNYARMLHAVLNKS